MRLNRLCVIRMTLVMLLFAPAGAMHANSLAGQDASPPVGLMGIAATVFLGPEHTCALTPVGGVKCWGNNQHGQLGDGTTVQSSIPVDVVGLDSGVVALAAGYGHTCAVTTDGGVKCWGGNWSGQLGDGTTIGRPTPVDVVGLSSDVAALAAGHGHTCALTTDGGVTCWGNNQFGQLGDGTTTDRSTPVDVLGFGCGVVAVSTSGWHTCAVTGDGGAKCWGNNLDGQLGDGTTTDRSTPVDVVGLSSGVETLAVGYGHACVVITDGGVKCWGENWVGQLGDGTTTDGLTPVDVVGLSSDVASLAAGYGHTCAVTIEGDVMCWGRNYSGQLGDGTTVQSSTPVGVVDLGSCIVALALGWHHSCVATSDGDVKCWGGNYNGQLGIATILWQLTPVDVVGLSCGSVASAASWDHTCMLATDGDVKCWGGNSSGQLGDGTTVQSSTPVDVEGLGCGVVALAVGEHHTCALTTEGGVECWGGNYSGQLGDGTTIQSSAPVEVVGLGCGVAALAAGEYHTCAVTAGGGVKCWGENWLGQLGDGTTTDRSIVVDVVGLSSGVVGLAAGWRHTCALTTDGGVKCWGGNDTGQLGNGTTAHSSVPVDVVDLGSGVTALAAGWHHTCAVTTDGGVKCWGGNFNGQLGDGTTVHSSVPVDVVDLGSGATSLAAGVHTCAVTTDGGVKCWGNNQYGQLGDGTLLHSSIPVDVVDLSSGVVSLAAGWRYTCVVISGGGVKCWGDDSSGQLGIGTIVHQLTPVNAAGLDADAYSVFGNVHDDLGVGIEGVTISAGSTGTATTDDNGDYVLSNVVTGTYTLVPEKSGYSFEPASRQISLPPDAIGQDFTGQRIPKPWTLMFYIAADNEQYTRLTHQYALLPQSAANPSVNIVAFWDGLSSEASYDYFSPEGGVVRVAQGELSTGHPSTLRDFVLWSQQTYPAEHYALVISDHGSGVGGVALDNDPINSDFLTPSELKESLAGIPDINVLYMDACLMGTIESAYQLREVAEYYVASESVTWGAIRPDWFVLGHQVDDMTIPPISSATMPEELATNMSRSWVIQGKYVYRRPSTASVARLANVADVAQRAHDLAGLLRENISVVSPILDAMRSENVLQHYDMTGDYEITERDEYVDLYHFAEVLASRVESTDIQEAAALLMSAVDAYTVFVEPGWSGSFTDPDGRASYWSHENSHGVSIFFPSTERTRSFYTGDWLDFAAGTDWHTFQMDQFWSPDTASDTAEWGQFLVDYIHFANPTADDDPNPPPLLGPFPVENRIYLPLVMRF